MVFLTILYLCIYFTKFYQLIQLNYLIYTIIFIKSLLYFDTLHFYILFTHKSPAICTISDDIAKIETPSTNLIYHTLNC